MINIIRSRDVTSTFEACLMKVKQFIFLLDLPTRRIFLDHTKDPYSQRKKQLASRHVIQAGITRVYFHFAVSLD